MESNSGGSDMPPWEYHLRKYLLLLATLVATVTYTGGLNLPGGVWQDSEDGHLAGDPILRATHYRRYLVFYYCNAAAFSASLVVIPLILVLNKKSRKLLTVLRLVMLLDLLGLLGAYVAGSLRDIFTTWYASVLVVLVFAYVVLQMLLALKKEKASSNLESPDHHQESPDHHKESPDILRLKERRKVLMLLATFMTTITYVAGLNPPGGFWDNTQDNHLAGDPILSEQYLPRLTSFFVLNTTTFVASLLIVMVLLDRKLTERITVKSFLLYAHIFVALLGLMGAYAAGSCREIDDTAYAISLTGAVIIYIFLQMAIVLRAKGPVLCNGRCGKDNSPEPPQNLPTVHGDQDSVDISLGALDVRQGNIVDTLTTPKSEEDNKEKAKEGLDKARSLVLLLATLAASITFQAGLDPPGGFWQDDADGHQAGDPILSTSNAGRYKVFFYCNSTAFVASLVSILLVQSEFLLRKHILEAAMILNLFGLMGAYAAGSCREASSSIYVIALAGAVLVYVVIHIVFFTLDHKANGTKPILEKRRKQLLLLAILTATLTYQAGLTPPGGSWLKNDEFGHQAGHPVLFDNYPRRYNAFFYCNAASFMASIALIILLVNPNLYKPGIECKALYVCMVAGLFGLMGAYSAGSSRHLQTSIYVVALVAAVIALIIVLLVSQWYLNYRNKSPVQTVDDTRNNSSEQEHTGTETESSMPGGDIKGKDLYREQYNMRKYLMLLGILAASVTYQSGLEPPGGVWQNNSNRHTAGNPVLYDINKPRYQAFFYSNSTSFMASVVVIVLLIQEALQKNDLLLYAMHSAVVLDLLGLLVAYAAGCSRKLETSGYVIALVIVVLIYIAILVVLLMLKKGVEGFFLKGILEERK